MFSNVCGADTAFPAQLPDLIREAGPNAILTLGITPFTFPAVEETTDETFLGLEKLQHLLTDRL